MADAACDITWIHVTDHYDRHLSGCLRCGPQGRYHHFAMTREEWVPDPEDPEDGRFDCEWSVYAVPAGLALPHLRRVRGFRSMVW